MEAINCPNCGHKFSPPPPEPPVGTWVKDRYGETSQRRTYQGQTGWGEPGIMPFGEWKSMWEARGPLVECGPWGAEKSTQTEES